MHLITLHNITNDLPFSFALYILSLLVYEQLAFKFKKIGYKIQLQQQRHQQRMDEIIMKENSMKMMNHHQHGSSSLQQSHQQQQQQHQSKFQTNEDIDV